MKLYYFEDPIGNFGDDLNPWLWSRLIPDILDEDNETLFLGIGTLLNQRIPENPLKVVFGAGVGYGAPPVIGNGQWKIYCLRGPLSAKALGLSADFAITDSAALIRTQKLPKPHRTKKISFMPHRRSIECGDWGSVCNDIGMALIDPRSDVDTVLQEIMSSQIVITEAMHGAIVADALRIPWIPVKAYNYIFDFKWIDWCKSVGIKYRPILLSSLWQPSYFKDIQKWYYGWHNSTYMKMRFKIYNFCGAIYAKAVEPSRKEKLRKELMSISDSAAVLSADSIINSVSTRLEEKLDEFKKDYFSKNLW